MDRLYKRLAARRTFVVDMEEAYRGRHNLLYASDKFREHTDGRYREFSDNWCKPVADAPSERLGFNGFRLDSDSTEPLTDDERQLQLDWHVNELDMQASQGTLTSVITGRSFALVWGDDDGPIVTWEHPAETIVEHDPETRRRRLFALKTWHDDDTEYATLYTPDEVYKFERPFTSQRRQGNNAVSDGFFHSRGGLYLPNTESGNWKPRQPSTDNSWPLPNPLGEVPVVEFPNRPMLGGEPLSDIAGVLSMQHAINLLWMYMFNAADFASMPARVVMGEEPPKVPILDDNGAVVGQKPVDMKTLSQNRIAFFTGQNTKIGQWDPADLKAFTPIIEEAVTHIAAQTRTPPHYLVMGKGMVNVSAEGMKAAETGLVMKVREAQTFLTPATRNLYRLMALARGNDRVADACRTGSVQWRDAENRSDAQKADALLKKRTMGYPFQWIAEQDGNSDTEVARIMKLRQQELESDPVGAMAVGLGTQMPAAPAEDTPEAA